jgi:hypothetical protein
VLSGAVTASQIRSHVAGANIQFSPAVASELELLAEDPVDYWAARSQREWS